MRKYIAFLLGIAAWIFFMQAFFLLETYLRKFEKVMTDGRKRMAEKDSNEMV